MWALLGQTGCRITLLLHLSLHCLYTHSIFHKAEGPLWEIPSVMAAICAELITVSKQLWGNYGHFNQSTDNRRILLHSTLSTWTFHFILFIFFYLAVPGLICGMWDLVPWPGIEPGYPTLGVWSLNHWTAREVPAQTLKWSSHKYLHSL